MPGPGAANVRKRHILNSGACCFLLGVPHVDASGGGGGAGQCVSWKQGTCPGASAALSSSSKMLFLLIFPRIESPWSFITQVK